MCWKQLGSGRVGLRSACDISGQALTERDLAESQPFPTQRFLLLWSAGLLTLQLRV